MPTWHVPMIPPPSLPRSIVLKRERERERAGGKDREGEGGREIDGCRQGLEKQGEGGARDRERGRGGRERETGWGGGGEREREGGRERETEREREREREREIEREREREREREERERERERETKEISCNQCQAGNKCGAVWSCGYHDNEQTQPITSSQEEERTDGTKEQGSRRGQARGGRGREGEEGWGGGWDENQGPSQKPPLPPTLPFHPPSPPKTQTEPHPSPFLPPPPPTPTPSRWSPASLYACYVRVKDTCHKIDDELRRKICCCCRHKAWVRLTPSCTPSGSVAGWCLSPPQTRSGCSPCLHTGMRGKGRSEKGGQ